jgi:hypothetical protein
VVLRVGETDREGRARKENGGVVWGGEDEPDISSISTCVAWSFSISVAFRPSSVTPDSSAMVGRCGAQLVMREVKVFGSCLLAR